MDLKKENQSLKLKNSLLKEKVNPNYEKQNLINEELK